MQPSEPGKYSVTLHFTNGKEEEDVTLSDMIEYTVRAHVSVFAFCSSKLPRSTTVMGG
jgi:hypothetical protein